MVVYTTYKSRKLHNEMVATLAIINSRIQNGKITLHTEVIDPRKIKPVVTPSTKKLDWGWYKREFTQRAYDDGYDIVGFHFTETYKKRWKIKPTLNGSYRNDPDKMLEFWFCANYGKKAKGYKNTTEVFRLLCHELLHGCYRWTGINSDFVHHLDYVMKDVAQGFYLVNLASANLNNLQPYSRNS